MTLHFEVEGSGPPVFLGPSLGTDLHLFDAQAATLRDRFRVIRYDLPGHGRSPEPTGPVDMSGLAEAVLEIAAELDIARFHYVGVSLGGAIGQQLAIDHGDRLTSLTLIATAAQFLDPPSWPVRAATVREQGTAAMVASRLGTWYTPRLAQERPDEEQRVLDMLRATSAEGYAACCEAIGAFDVRERLAEIGVPTLAIAGAEDPATPPALLELIASRIPGAKLVVLPGTAHLPVIEDPGAINEALLAHLEQ